MKQSAWSTAGGLFLAFLTCAPPVEAEDSPCTASFESGQELRASGDRLGARRELKRCAAACREELRRYCVTWITEVEAELSSLIVVARRGEVELPLAQVEVRIDGAVVKSEHGRLVVEPGKHRVEIAHRGETASRALTLEPGLHTVVLTFPTPRAPPPAVDRPDAGPPVATWVLLALGSTALTAAAILAINGHVERAQLVDSCAPACHPETILPIERQWYAAGVLAGAGAAALVGAGIAAAVGPDGAPSAALVLHGVLHGRW